MDNIISNVLAGVPGGLWEKIIMCFEGGIGSFAVSIILLTLIIKLVMSPVDFFNRRTQKRMAYIQQRIQPQVEAINKRYQKDEKTKNQKLGELYQREKVNPMGSCLVMLLNLGLTLAIFITLLNGMNAMAQYKIASQYEQLQIAYVQEYAGERLDLTKEGSTVYQICLPFIEEINALDETTKTQVINKANENVKKVYNETKEGFLWIENIWLADNPFQSPIPTYSEYATVARLDKEQKENKEYENVYNQIMNPIRDSIERPNGYFILLVICAVTTFLNQFLVMRRTKQANQPAKRGSGWGTIVFMTIFMSVFTLMYTTMFSIYLITGQIVGLLTMPLIELINKAIDKHQEKKKMPTDRLKRI